MLARSNNGKADALAYLQGQLIAAGHISKPLDVSRLSESEARRLEKCLNGLLSKAAVCANTTSLPSNMLIVRANRPIKRTRRVSWEDTEIWQAIMNG